MIRLRSDYRTDDEANPTWLIFSKQDWNYPNTSDRGTELLSVKLGDHIVYRPANETWAWYDLIIIAAPIDTIGTPGYVRINVVVNQTATNPILPTGSDKVFFQFIRYNPTPVSVGDVADIVTDELQIPRIEPTEIIEDENSITEVQTITPSGTITAGTFKLTLLGVQTGNIAWNASAAQIETAIDAVISGNSVRVSGGPLPTAAIILSYNDYGDVAQVTVQPTLTGGGVLTPATTTEGIPGFWVEAGFTEDERTHDGLWVVATGGLANT